MSEGGQFYRLFPATMQERLNRLALEALYALDFTNEDSSQASDAFFFPKKFRHLPIRMYLNEMDTPSTIYRKILTLVWSKKIIMRRTERKFLYTLADTYLEKVEELIEKDISNRSR